MGGLWSKHIIVKENVLRSLGLDKRIAKGRIWKSDTLDANQLELGEGCTMPSNGIQIVE